MAGKQMILLHLDGVKAYEERDWRKALSIFQQIEIPSSVIYFNIGCCYLNLGQFDQSESSFEKCIAKDKYLAVGYYQLAVAQTYAEKYPSAITNFIACLEALRGNSFIDYKQLNLTCKIHECDVRCNLGLLYLFSGDYDNAMIHLKAAVELAADEKHFAHEAIRAMLSESWDVFGQSPLDRLVKIGLICVFRPNKAKLEGLKSTSNFINSAKVVSATNDEYSFVGFVGPKKLQKQRENETDSSPNLSQGIATPPVPSVAPPRRLKPPSAAPPTLPKTTDTSSLATKLFESTKYKGIPSPPSNSPPPLRKVVSPAKQLPPSPSVPPPSLPFKSSPVHSNNKTANVKSPRSLSPTKRMSGYDQGNMEAVSKQLLKTVNKPDNRATPVMTKQKHTAAVMRPPPPSQSSLKQKFNCELTVSVAVTKSKIKSYTEFKLILCDKLKAILRDIESGSSTFSVKPPSNSTEPGVIVNEQTWRDVFLKGVRESSLALNLKEVDSPVKLETKLPAFPQNTHENSVAMYEDDIYVDATAHGGYIESDDNALYATAVFSSNSH